MIRKKAKEVIRKEAEAIAQLEKKIDENFVKAVELILKCKGRVIVTGIGKSGIIGKKIAATLTSTGTASFFLHPTEGIHGDLGMVQKNDVVIAITKSGGTDEVYQLIPLFKRQGVPIITFTGNPDSPVAEKSDLVIDVSVDQEACPHNRGLPAGDAGLAATSPPLGGARIADILRWRQEDWDRATGGSATRRAKCEIFLRNAKIAARNAGD